MTPKDDALSAQIAGEVELFVADKHVEELTRNIVRIVTEFRTTAPALSALARETKLYPDTTTLDYRLAPSGEGPLAYEWSDKPHRLVYDLCSEVERLQSALAQQGASAGEWERILTTELRALGCKCPKPLIGYSPGCGPRCRLCQVDAEDTWRQQAERIRELEEQAEAHTREWDIIREALRKATERAEQRWQTIGEQHKRITQLEGALRHYGQHNLWCPKNPIMHETGTCNCGLDEVLTPAGGKEVTVNPLKEASRQAREALDPLVRAATEGGKGE